MVDPNILLESSETILLNQEQILINMDQGTQILNKLALIEKMDAQEVARNILLNDGLELQQPSIGKTVITATDVLCIIDGEIGAGNIIKVVDAKQAILKLDIPLVNGTYGFDQYKSIISSNATFHKDICLPFECKPLNPKLVQMVSPTTKIILQEMNQLAVNGKTSFVQTYLDVKSPRHLNSRIGIAVMLIGAISKTF
jgi:hypothetical protein